MKEMEQLRSEESLREKRGFWHRDLFPTIDRRELPEVLRSERLREEVEADIRKNPDSWRIFQSLDTEYREKLIEFCMGNRGLNVLYDPFFKYLMTNERLERLLSQIMEQQISIVSVEHIEVKKRSSEASVMIMDLLVKLADGSYVNLELQRITFDFPFERAVCYSSDIMVNQYDQLKLEQKQKQKEWRMWKKRQDVLKKQGIEVEEIDPEPPVKFDYRSLRPVYVIVLMNSSARKYSAFSEAYIHRSLDNVEFDTGLKEAALQKYIFISLDNFRKLKDNERKRTGASVETEQMSELEAWMYFLASDQPEDIRRVIQDYPEFEEMYREIIWFRYHPEEMMSMLPEAIRMMDEGSFQTMLETRDEKLRKQAEMIAAKEREIEEGQQMIAAKEREIEEGQQMIAAKDHELAEGTRTIKELQQTIVELEKKLAAQPEKQM